MTVNPPAIADHGTFTVRRTISIAASPDKVWAAITEPEHVSRWFGRLTLTGSTVGSAGSIAWPDQPPVPIRIEAIDPPRTITYRWCNGSEPHRELDEATSTVFTFTLVPAAGGTELTVEESGFEAALDPGVQLEEHRQGWDGELDKLVALLEGPDR
ncbi:MULTISPECIES: SRPBCC domain-containing protein [unclassified Nocardioides]|uniref:SRPBCC domain-containing protein n=1 Tax=unclassified Nocardioides TaxID=2615069 RepID=UPI00361F9A7D